MKAPFLSPDYKLGILGGGQLGKMLCQVTSSWSIYTRVLDASSDFPAAATCNEFIEGDFTSAEDVVSIAHGLSAATIEIEKVSSAGLRQLIDMGITVHPNPDALDIIKDKGLQKEFYRARHLATSDFALYNNKAEVKAALADDSLEYPFVLKARTGGYDGRGVAIIRSETDLEEAFDAEYLQEPLLDIDVEVAIIVARNEDGQMHAFPPVGMDFHPTANLVEYLYCPVDLEPRILRRAEELAFECIEAYGICGLLAVEMFVTRDGQVLLNEVAPRPHNSGHHTIEACNVSQFEQHIRGVTNLPLAEVHLLKPAVMVNILGAEGHTGPAVYHGIRESLALQDVYVHIYGKTTTKPYRKMGHVTVLGNNLGEAIEKANHIKSKIRVTT